MKKLLQIFGLIICWMPIDAQVLTFSETFTNGQTPSAAICNKWQNFKGSLDPNLQFTRLRFSGSLSTTVFECTDPAIVQDIAANLRILPSSDKQWVDGSNKWQIAISANGRFGVNNSTDALSSCDNPGYLIKPCMTNANWGGFGTATCTSNPTQVITIEFFYSTAPNDAQVSAINPVPGICPGSYPVEVEVKNSGINQIDSVTVGWSVDGVMQTAVKYVGLLDTLGGAGSQTAIVNLGNFNFAANQTYDIKAWTMNPNGVADTVNDNDTLPAVLSLQSLTGLAVANITASSVDVNWNTLTGSSYMVKYGPSGFDPVTGGTGITVAATAVPYTINTLTASTLYDVYVAEDCGGGTLTSYLGPVSFNTLCSGPLAAGTYTVDPSAPQSATNFVSFSTVEEVLNECGVSGPVVINVAEGVYNEQISLANITGASTVNTVTIQADPANTSPAELMHNAAGSSDNYVIRFNGTSHVTIRGMKLTASGTTYARVIDFSGDSDFLTIEDNILNGLAGSTSTSTDIAVIMNNSTSTNRLDSSVVRRNEIHGGSYGLYWYGVGSTDMESGNTIDSNIIDGFSYAGIWSYYQKEISVRGNTVTGSGLGTGENGIRHYYNDFITSTGNTVVCKGSSTNNGYYLYYCDADATTHNLIANNMVSVLNGSGTSYGIYVTYNLYTDIVYNSVLLNSSAASPVLYINGSTATTNGNVRIINNNLVHTGGGMALETTSGGASGITESDYNNFYTTGTDLAEWSGSPVTDLAALRTASSKETNSVSGDPVFRNSEDLTPLGTVTNDVALVLSFVTVDIEGNPRPATPDIGAIEYTPINADLAVVGGAFVKNFPCLSSSDTIAIYVQNIIGDTVDFTLNPLTAHFSVTGPVNSSGTITQNTGKLAPLDTLIMMSYSADLSVLGEYSLSAWIDSNATNTLGFNDTLSPGVSITVDSILTVDPKRYTLEVAGDSVRISASSPFFGGGSFFISEVCHYKYSVGAPSGGWPSYLTADDYIEITGVPGSDLGGITLEQWDGSSMLSTHTFPAGTLIGPNGTAIIAIGQLAGSVESPANYYYHGTGSFTGSFSSGGNNGRILKDAGGNIIDAVGVGTTYTFPAASGVTAADWSGNSGNHSATSGVRLIGLDDNTATNWIVSNVSPQDPNVLNSGVLLPAPMNFSGVTWTLNGATVDTVPAIYVGPFSVPGDYEYVVTFVSPCGITYTDTVVVTAPDCALPTDLEVTAVTSDSATVSWTAAGNATGGIIIIGSPGFNPATAGTTINTTSNPVRIGGLTAITDYEIYVLSDCSINGYSDTIGPLAFRTPCGALNAPYSEDFEDFTVGFYNGDENCWTVESNNPGTTPSGGFSWEVRNTPQTTSSGTGPAGDNTYYPADTGYYFHSDNSGGSVGDSSVLLSPLVNISALTDPVLEFYVHYFSSPTSTYNQSLHVDVYDGSTWTNDIYVLSDPIHSSSTDPWTPVYISLTPYSGSDLVRARFRVYTGTSTGGAGDISLDDINFVEAPACPDPSNLKVDTLTNNSATVSFEWIIGSNGSFAYEYGPTGYSVGTGTLGTGGNPLVATGMSQLTTYDLYIRANCGSSGNSSWIGPVTFTTGCDNQLNGTYTINPAQPASATNFTSIASAMTAVNLCGVSGPVVFNIKEGSYTAQMDFSGNPLLGNAIVGSSATNTITFQADPSNTSPVEIKYDATGTDDNFVVNFNGSSYITLKGLTFTALGTTYARVINFSGASKGIAIEDNILNGHPSPATTSTNIAVVMNNSAAANRLDSSIIKGNTINGGSYALYWYGIGTTDMESGNSIDSNIISGFYYAGIWSYYQENLTTVGNKVTGGGTYTTEYGIRHYYNDHIISTGNKVVCYGTSSSYPYYVYYCDGSVGNPNIVANNMSSALDNSGAAQGMYVYYCTYTDVLHNTMLVNASSTTAGVGLYVAGSSSQNDVRILNNIIANTGGGVALEVTSGGVDMISEIDYNNYFATGTDFADWDGNTVASLTALKALSAMDSNSVSGDPVFLADDDLHVLGGTANNRGVVVSSVTTDIDGESRSLTTPDIGADEYTPTSSDLALIAAEFRKNFPCLSSSDTIALYVQNIIGTTVDFSVNPLNAHYNVTGPVNTSGTVVQNTGTLAPLDTLVLLVTGIDLSIVGEYNLDAWIDSNFVNVISMNDSLFNAASIEIDSLLKVRPKRMLLEGSGDSVLISARSPFFSGGGSFFISEVCHYKYSVGAPVGGWPSYLIADDYIEITGVPGSDLGGITLEQWSTTALISTHTFAPGTYISPNGTAIIAIGQMGSSVESPSDYYYHGNGTYTGSFSSGGNNGRILKDATGAIIDAVGVGTTYTFPAASGVTPADWSGNSGNHTTTSGVRLIGPDDNTATNWIVSNVSPQDPNVPNSGVIIPAPEEGQPGFTWTLNGAFVDSIPAIYVGPFSNPGDYKYVATFVSPCGITYVDTVVITAPSCPLPSDLSVSGVTSNSAVLSWTSSSNAVNWRVIYDTTGFNPATGGATVIAGSNPYTLTGLNPNYTYDFYIVSNCGTTDGISDTAGPVSFRTPCTAITAPHLEDFEMFTVGFFNGEEDCWVVQSNNPGTTASGGFSWEVRNTKQTTSSNTGPAGDNTLYPATGGHYFHSDNSGASVGDSSILISPQFDVSAMINPELKFFVYFFSTPTSAYNQKLYVDVYNGSTWVRDVYQLTSPLHTSDAQPWDSVMINLMPFNTTGLVQVRFRVYTGTSTGGAGDISIDDVSISEGPTCPAPSGFEMSSYTTNSAMLTWVPGSSNAVSYVVEYGLPGFTPGTGTKVTTTTNSVMIGSLPANIPYEAYLKANCGGGDSSAMVGPVIFGAKTLCDDLEGYSAGLVANQSLLFQGWYGDGVDGAFSTTRALSGTKSLRIYDTGTGGASDVVAAFDPITSGIWDVSFSMYVENGAGAYYNIQQNYDPSGVNNLWGGEVYFDSSGTATVEYGNPATTVGTFSYTQGQWERVTTIIDLDNDTIWIELNGTSTGIGWAFSAANGAPLQFNGVNFYSGVYGTGAYDIDYYADDFCVSDASPCPVPTALGATNITSSGADIFWTSTGTTWNVEYGTSGFSPGSGTMTTSTSTTMPLSGLTANTCYDFYVQNDCSTEVSNWAGPYTFCTKQIVICNEAGADNSVVVCDTTTVNLANFLSGADAGGVWVDADGTGALNGSMFDATSVAFNMTYDFLYVFAATQDCAADTAVISVTVDSCKTGLEESLLSRSLEVYPNPTAGEVNIRFETEGSESAEIRILDLSGKLVYRSEARDLNGVYSDNLSLEQLAKGTYLLKIQSGSMQAVRRIVKQ